MKSPVGIALCRFRVQTALLLLESKPIALALDHFALVVIVIDTNNWLDGTRESHTRLHSTDAARRW